MGTQYSNHCRLTMSYGVSKKERWIASSMDKAIRLEAFLQLIIPAMAICLISQMAENLPSLIYRCLNTLYNKVRSLDET